jgi:chemotaxis protein methyltransferase CheR
VTDQSTGAAGRVLARRVGLRLDPGLRGRLARSVREEAAARGLDVPGFVARLETDAGLLQGLIDRVTVQETSFFRDPAQYEAVRDHVLPATAGPVRAWSAGCAHGQEPYSLAMVLAESGRRDWEVVASDVASRALARTRLARYSPAEVRGVSGPRRARFFTETEGTWEVTAPLRQRVRVIRHNLVADPPPFEPHRCRIVFCRNVLIYLRSEDAVAFLERLARWLHPEGWLFLGYSESLWQLTDAFRLERLGPAFAYRPRAAPRPPPTAPAATPSPTAPTATPSATPSDTPSVTVALLAEGEAAMNAGDYAAAVAAYRRCAYLDPDHPLAHLHLGLAHDAAGDPGAARRAFSTARQVLGGWDTASVEAALEGYRPAELVRLLDEKLADR